MCKTNMETYVYYVKICKHEHEKNMTKLLCKIMPKTNVEWIERNEGFYSYLYPFEDLVQRSFLKTFLVENQLWVNWNLIWT
jgi:hypothetical protein